MDLMEELNGEVAKTPTTNITTATPITTTTTTTIDTDDTDDTDDEVTKDDLYRHHREIKNLDENLIITNQVKKLKNLAANDPLMMNAYHQNLYTFVAVVAYMELLKSGTISIEELWLRMAQYFRTAMKSILSNTVSYGDQFDGDGLGFLNGLNKNEDKYEWPPSFVQFVSNEEHQMVSNAWVKKNIATNSQMDMVLASVKNSVISDKFWGARLLQLAKDAISNITKVYIYDLKTELPSGTVLHDYYEAYREKIFKNFSCPVLAKASISKKISRIKTAMKKGETISSDSQLFIDSIGANPTVNEYTVDEKLSHANYSKEVHNRKIDELVNDADTAKSHSFPTWIISLFFLGQPSIRIGKEPMQQLSNGFLISKVPSNNIDKMETNAKKNKGRASSRHKDTDEPNQKKVRNTYVNVKVFDTVVEQLNLVNKLLEQTTDPIMIAKLEAKKGKLTEKFLEDD